jgi:BolA protein
MQEQLEDVLSQALTPQVMYVDNESHLHSSGKGNNSHFKITLVADAFQGLTLVARHRAVQAVLRGKTEGIHALGLHTYTPEEWLARGEEEPDSPACSGGGHTH